MPRRAPHQIVDQLGTLLAAERDALVKGDGDALDRATQRKSDCLPELGAALAALPAAERRAVTDRLGDRVAELQRFNELNGAILASRLAMNRARLEVLLSAAGGATYGAQGQVDGPSAAARHAPIRA